MIIKDKKVHKLITLEKQKQQKCINLIASENFVSRDVCKAVGSVFMNKYAEGYPGKRYYSGCKYIDDIENLAKERALKLFNLKDSEWSVNVQSLSGSIANLAVLYATVPFGEKIMGMSLSSGGHLSHGQSVSITGKLWKQISFNVDKKTELLDYRKIKMIAKKEKPKLIIAGFTAYPRNIDWKKFKEIADSCNALLVADISHISGLIAGKQHSSPFPYADIIVTTTHKTLRGPRGALIFSKKIKYEKEKTLAELIDKAVFPSLQGGPHINTIAGIAVALNEASESEFKIYAKQVILNAKCLLKELKKLGWKIVTNGTDNHIVIIDTWNDGHGIPGDMAMELLEKEGVLVNKNTIPHDKRSANSPSGIRLGTSAETSRGKKEYDFKLIAKKINDILSKNYENN